MLAIVGIATLVIVVVSVGSLQLIGARLATDEVTAEQLAQCAELMEVSFPESTQAAGYWALMARKRSINLKVYMDAVDLAGFLESSPFAVAEVRTDRQQVPAEPENAPRWWTPEAVTDFQSAVTDFESDGGRRGLAFVAGREPDEGGDGGDGRIVVYLRWFDP